MTGGVAIVGGCGRAGLPLSIAFADAGLQTHTIDINPEAVASVNQGEMPFDEAGAPEALARTIGSTLHATTDPSIIADCEFIVIIIGTPVDEHLNPDPQAVPAAIRDIAARVAWVALPTCGSSTVLGQSASPSAMAGSRS